MEQTETAARAAGRPRPWLVVTLGVVLTIYLVWWLLPGKSAAPAATPSNRRVVATRPQVVDPADLNVQLEALTGARPPVEGGRRNPFRFYVPPPPPPPPEVAVPVKPVPVEPDTPVLPTGPPPPPPLPKIPLKYIGLIEGVPDKGKLAAFSDCRSTMSGREGEIIDGRYRLVRIGVESVVMEYADGRGRETIRQSGEDCVKK